MQKKKNTKAWFTETVKAETALRAVLMPQGEAIAKRWSDMVHGTYPFDTVGFLRTKTDPFSNPVGFRTGAAAKAIAAMLFNERPDEELLLHEIEEIMRVRAVQNFAPEAAVSIFFAIKDILRELVFASDDPAACLPALLPLESRIDAVALMAFGSYARCRETLHLLRVDEVKRSVSQVTRLAERKAMKLIDKE